MRAYPARGWRRPLGVTMDVVYFSAGCLMLALLLIGTVGDLVKRE
ncbi:MAG: hypothetical protein ACE15B_04380 [Bryobacteraceae bacterium]